MGLFNKKACSGVPGRPLRRTQSPGSPSRLATLLRLAHHKHIHLQIPFHHWRSVCIHSMKLSLRKRVAAALWFFQNCPSACSPQPVVQFKFCQPGTSPSFSILVSCSPEFLKQNQSRQQQARYSKYLEQIIHSCCFLDNPLPFQRILIVVNSKINVSFRQATLDEETNLLFYLFT